jgi:streptomycin 6-kinase
MARLSIIRQSQFRSSERPISGLLVMIVVPETFAINTIAREGVNGRIWVNNLPHLVESLCAKWNLVVDGLPMHGYFGLVVPVRRGDNLCVLKLSWVTRETQDEAAALLAWRGRGAVQLLAHEPLAGAMLLERLDFSRPLQDVAIEEAVVVAGKLLLRLAIPGVEGFRPLREVAPAIGESLGGRWAANGHPFSRSVLEKSQYYARELSGQTADQLVNWDIHYENILAGEREPWLVVDPKVVIGDPEYGLAQLLFTRLEDMQANGGLARHFRLLVEAAELDNELARAWTLVRCVDYWLWALSMGFTIDPERCRVIVEWLG